MTSSRRAGIPRAPLGYRNDKHKDEGDKTISPNPKRFVLIRQT